MRQNRTLKAVPVIEELPVSVYKKQFAMNSKMTPRILVVESSFYVFDFCKRLLDLESFEVELATDADTARRMILTGEYDLFLVDVKTPVTASVELYNWLSGERADLAQRILFIGDFNDDSVYQFIQSTGRPCLPKPFAPSELRERIKQQIVVQQIARRREAEAARAASEERYRIITEQTGKMVYDYDVISGRIEWQGAIQNVTGFTPEEYTAVDISTWEAMIHEDDRAGVLVELEKSRLNHSPFSVEYRYQHKDGSYHYVEDTGVFLIGGDGKWSRMLGSIGDIEARKRVQQLELETKAAVMANKAKSDMLTSMSHELRTPLNAIIGFSQVLQESYFGTLNEKQGECVEDILASGQHLLTLINEILDLSKIEAGKVELELGPVNVKSLLENSLFIIKEKANRHDLRLDTNIAENLAELEILADERRLKQVIFNLLSNAAKFTPNGGEINLSAEKRNGEIAISVADSGIGIERKYQEKIFEGFFQIQNSLIDKTPGTGLGLSLARRLVELHGGRIWVESEGAGKGSRFVFILPINLAQEGNSVGKEDLDRR